MAKSKQQVYEELQSLLSAKRKQVTENNFSKFIEVYLDHMRKSKSPKFHAEMQELLELQANRREGHNRLLFIAPRGFAKSTVNSRFFPLWLAAHGKRQDIFIVSATISLAKEHLRAIREELEVNEKLVRDFGNMKSDKWTEDHLILSNKVNIRAKGRGFQIRGFRPDIVICDDLEDEEVIYSKEQRDKTHHWFYRTLVPALKPHQDMVYVGTILHQFSLIMKLREVDDFMTRFYRAIGEDGKSVWEEEFPTKVLKKFQRENNYAFQAEYMNNPISLEEQPVKQHMIEGIRVDGTRRVSCMAVDPAISEKETSDYRAITIFERTDEGFREVITKRGRWSVTKQAEEIIALYEKYKPTKILLEEVAFQKVFREILKNEAEKLGIYLPLQTAELGVGKDKRPKDKLTRLMEVVHLFEQQKVEIRSPDLYEEILAFPFGDYDDMVDAMVYSLYFLKEYRISRGAIETKVDLHLPTKESFRLKEVRPGVYYASAEEFLRDPVPTNTRFINYDKN